MIDSRTDSKLFEEVVRELLAQGLSLRFQARGASMSPAIRDGDIVEITPVIVSKLRKDDIVLAKTNNGFRLHRIVAADFERNLFVTRGDCGQENDPVLNGEHVLGLAQAKEVRLGRKIVQVRLKGVGGRIVEYAARGQRVASRLWKNSGLSSVARKRAGSWLGILCLLFVVAKPSSAQVTVDTTTSGSATVNGTANITFGHTTANVLNRLLIVGVSINITNNSAGTVTAVTWGGTALTRIGAHNDSSNTRRVEMWYLLAPAVGFNNVVVSVSTGGGQEGVVAGATTFTGVDQNIPLGTFVSADGAAGAYSAADVPSVINGMILDTLSTDGTQTVTIPGPQAQAWNVQRGNSTVPGVRGVGTTRTGAPSVPISETFSGTSNWSLGAISINPSTADISVSTSVSAVP